MPLLDTAFTSAYILNHEDLIMFESFDIKNIVYMVVPILMALTVHEFAHGLAAYRLGDNTARDEGRLTLNPLSHLDLVGSLMLFFSGLFGWAKPVPFNPANFKNPPRDTALVAVAGPLANFITAVAVALIFKLTIALGFWDIELGGSGWQNDLLHIIITTIMINITLGLFNLLPFPPLDGFKVLSYFLPESWVISAEKHSLIFLVIFLALLITGKIQAIISPITYQLFNLMIR